MLAGQIQLVQQLAAGWVAHIALDPGQRDQALAARHLGYVMQTGGWVDDRIAGRELDASVAKGGAHHQLATVVVLGRAQEHGHGDVAAKARSGASHDRVVHMIAVGHAGSVACEDGIGDPMR